MAERPQLYGFDRRRTWAAGLYPFSRRSIQWRRQAAVHRVEPLHAIPPQPYKHQSYTAAVSLLSNYLYLDVERGFYQEDAPQKDR